MANEEYLQRLRQGVSVWNVWKQEHPKIRIDLRNAVLSRIDLSGADLRGATLSGADLRGATLSGADLRGATLSGADLGGATLSGADFRQTNLVEANLNGATLTDASLWEIQRTGWSIQGIRCAAVYWDENRQKQTTYRSGEFEQFYANKTVKQLPWENENKVAPPSPARHLLSSSIIPLMILVLGFGLILWQLPRVHQYESEALVFVQVVASLIAAVITFVAFYAKSKGEKFRMMVGFGVAAALFLVGVLSGLHFKYTSIESIPPILSEFTRAAEIPLATDPGFLAVTPDSKKIYVSSPKNMKLNIIGIDSQKLEQNIKLAIEPSIIVFSHDGMYAFIVGISSRGDHNRGVVLKLDTMTRDIIGELEIGKDVFAIGSVISLDDKQLYVSNANEPFLTVVDTITLQIIKKIRLDVDQGGGFGLAITPDGLRIYITHGFSNSIGVIDTENNTVVKVIKNVGSQPVAIATSVDGSRAYVVNTGESSVSIVDLVKSEIISKVFVGPNSKLTETKSWPFANIYTTQDDKYIIVWDFHLPYISIIDSTTLVERSVIEMTNKISSVAMNLAGNILVYSQSVQNKIIIMYRNQWQQ